MNKIWNYLNGNKTLICMIILYAMTLDSVKAVIPADVLNIVEYTFGILGFAAAGHKVKKAVS